jgi:hypothetical protein
MDKSTFKSQRFLLFTLFALAVLTGLTSHARAQNADGNYLLTENGITNPQYSTYKNTPILKTDGDYFATPAFDKSIVDAGENGTIDKPTPFSKGILTNGDTSSDYHRRPMPYVYWTNQQKATLDFDLKKNYYISKVRVNVMLTPKVHGISKMDIFTWDELFEAGQIPLKELVPVNGWNEFDINKPTNKLRLAFTAQPGCAYMTVTEVEIWGHETDTQIIKSAPAKAPVKINATPRNYRAFDFGPADAPVYDDFTGVDDTVVYSKKRGYGWIPFANGKPLVESSYGAGSAAVPGLLERDRGKELQGVSDLYRDFCGAQAAYNTQVQQQFAVDLTDGNYLVYLTSGDLVYGHQGVFPMTVTAEGKRVISSVEYGLDLIATARFETKVTDGQLNLDFSSDEKDAAKANWNVSGLLIFPANDAAQKSAAIKTIDDLNADIAATKKAAFEANFTRIDHVETNKLFPLTAEQNQRGYLLFVRDWMKMIYPNSVPLKSEVDDTTINAAAAPGQYEPASVGVYPLKSTFDADVKVSDLVSDDQHKIGKENILIRLTGFLPERMKDETRTVGDDTYYLSATSSAQTYMEKVPKVLLPYDGKMNVDGTQQIWLTFHVPSDAKPGKYKGKMTFTPQGHPAQTLNIVFTVYSFQLQKSDRVEGVYWNDGSGMLYPQNEKKQLADMARHGIKTVVISYTIPEFVDDNGQLKLTFDALDSLVSDIQSAGLTGPLPIFTSTAVSHLKSFLVQHPDVKLSLDDAYKLYVAQTLQHSQEKHWPQILFYPVDEIGNSQKARDEFKHLGSLIREVPGAKIYVTANNYAAGEELAPYIDYQVVNIPLSKEQEQNILKDSKVYWRYGNGYNFNPRISRTVSGFGFWRLPATAMFYWHYQYVTGDPYNPLDGKGRDHILSYPSPSGPVNSIDFESVQQGIYDLNYIATMQEWMTKAQREKKATDIVQQGQAILNEINSADPSYSQYDLIGVPNEQYHQWRTRMAQVITQLQSTLH